MKKRISLICAAAVMVFAMVLTACGGKHVITMDLLDEVSGVKATVENAGKEDSAFSGGAITVNEGDVIIISPCMDKGSLHLTIASEDGATVVYDGDVDGRVLFQAEAVPGTYDVTVTGNGGSTGWMTVFSISADDLAAQEQSLDEALTEAGVDPSILPNG